LRYLGEMIEAGHYERVTPLTGRCFTGDQEVEVEAAIWVWDGRYAEGQSPYSDGWFCNEHDSEEQGTEYLVRSLGFSRAEIAEARG
jgi:hypothetical protein